MFISGATLASVPLLISRNFSEKEPLDLISQLYDVQQPSKPFVYTFENESTVIPLFKIIIEEWIWKFYKEDDVQDVVVAIFELFNTDVSFRRDLGAGGVYISGRVQNVSGVEGYDDQSVTSRQK